MSWYITKHKGERQWTAYKLSCQKARELRTDIEVRGPYKSLIVAWMVANKLEEKAEVRPA